VAPLILALACLAALDSLNILNVGVVSAVIFDSRLNRRSPVRGALSFIAGLLTVTSFFGVCTVLGLDFLTNLIDFRLTPSIRYRGEFLIGGALIALAYFPLTAQSPAPGWALASVRDRPWLLGIVGIAVGIGQAPTAVPYLTGLAMLTARDPRPPLWPLIVVAYCAITLWAPIAILAFAVRNTPRANRIQRRLVRALTRYGPLSVRILFLVFGVGLVVDAILHYRAIF
jgi:cytochrome c biogenesis protein CcdA